LSDTENAFVWGELWMETSMKNEKIDRNMLSEAVPIYDNIFWFLVDGLRPDFLHMDGAETEQNFIDRLISKGTTFNHVITAGSGTHTSMHSIFTALLPSYNGAAGWERKALRNFKQEIFTITDYLQLAGYETFRYDDALGERAVPMSGFKRWESGGYKTGRVLKNTNFARTKRLERFIEDVNNCKSNKFVYHHMELLHELNGELGTCWNSDDYAKNIVIAAREFEKIYYDYKISENDLVIVSSDHGVILDRDFMKSGKEEGARQYEQSVRAFFSLIGNHICPQILSRPISSLDEAPTILHLTLGEKMIMPGQGLDQYSYMKEGKYRDNIFFREAGIFATVRELQNSLTSELFYVRDGKWKYVYGERDPRCEWLIDLEENQDYEANLKDIYPELTEKYRKMIREKFAGGKDYQYQSVLGFDKKDILPKFSIVLQMEDVEKETIESLLDMGGPYYEIVAQKSEVMSYYQNHYKVCLVDTLDSAALKESCRGEWLIYVTENGEWSEYFLSDLYRYMQCHRNRHVKIRGEHYTAIKKEEQKGKDLIELLEEKQVRDIRYLHEENIEKKYILFGCGDIGKEAVDYFGEANIAYFADNNPGMVGKMICGKSVLSFDEFKKIYQAYTIMITTKAVFAKEISKQLKENGIYDYCLFEEYERKEARSCWESGYRVVKGKREENESVRTI